MKKSTLTRFLTGLLLPFMLAVCHPAQAQLISLENGHLVYKKYANQGQTDTVNQIPDYSNAGYRGGGVSIPVWGIADSISPIEGDNRAHIQAAIDRVSALPLQANGHRGVLLLKAGVYPVEGSLIVRASGVVLRGAGNGLNGTVLIATQKTQHDFLKVQGAGSGYGEVSGSKVRITSLYVATGSKTFDVAANHTFHVGDKVVVQKTPNDAWIDTLDMRQYGWTASGYKTTYERTVTTVSGSSITLDIPIVDPIDNVFGGGEVYRSNITGRISECGLELLRIESYFQNDEDESHGWYAIVFTRTENSWVKDVTGKYFGNGLVSLSNMSRFNTVQDCAMIDPKSVTTGGRKYSFNLDGNATSNLYQRCITWGGRHDYVSGSKVPGPNVFLDCSSENTRADIGPHHRWSTGQLYDNIYGGQIRVQNRGASGTGHGWSGAQTLFWNLYSYTSDILVSSPFGARNWGIGNIGKKQSGNGYWESWGTHQLPRSLYLQQLRERLSDSAVQNIVIPQQLVGPLWDSLRARGQRILAEPQVRYGADTVSASFDLTDNGGVITGQYPNTSKPTENFTSLIDNNTSTKYYIGGRKALWVQYASTQPGILTRYTLTSGNDLPERDPRNWNLVGSNDGVTWALIDSQINQTFASRKLTRSFSVDSNTIAYRYFRLNVTTNNGHTGTQFAEWELFERRSQSISFSEVPEITYGDEAIEGFSAFSTSGLPVTMEVISGPGTLTDSALHFTGAGTIVIRATQAGSSLYFPATAEVSISVAKATQQINFETVPEKIFGDSAFVLHATSDAGLPVTFELVGGPVTLTDSLVAITGAGIVTVRAKQAGNENYDSAFVEQSFVVLKAQQLIDFGAISAEVKGQTMHLTATATSGLPVGFSIAAGNGNLNGNVLKLNYEGLITIQADQAGNDNYEAAVSVPQTILVLGLGTLIPEIKATVYPNPTSGQFKVRLENAVARPHTFMVLDHRGNVVTSTIATPSGAKFFEVIFNISSSVDGIYYLHVFEGANNNVMRIIVKY
ncbi:T9SS type A sorting domain-containing protein [Chitinophaga sp. SYP-B3965]|uniref:T9SS type A sorting domain-containing protein n=1 Tax=Chitinophaga sp. SYP-B3965 TaxID=2663120 RepID=UPI0012995727|nr:T9SS type A sorting domain-containing protein [Chitinophaga sp. SYP-B3965]MRG47198.1 T9SS type A sorting domain-containing protein [Chitinophaga sp. SYP-B3965]